MNKKLGAILLIAGTCIGSGMIALPMVLTSLGLIPSVLLMLFIWFIMYYTSLVNLELNLQAGHGLTLGALGRLFSGKTAEWIGIISLKLLSYSLLAVFIYGGSSVIQELIATNLGVQYSFSAIALVYSTITFLLLLLPITFLDYVNRLLFISLLVVVAILLGGLVLTIHWSDLPWISDKYTRPSIWAAVIPVIFTSFGFQVIFHTLTNYCNKDAKMLKQAFFWGSLIPAIVYIVWTSSILSVIYHENPAFYNKMAMGKAEVGELVQTLGEIAKGQSVQLLVWWISILAIATSVLGVGVGLCDSLKAMLKPSLRCPVARNLLAALITVVPALIVVLLVPNAFITVLGFAGMILAVIAILLPVYLFWNIEKIRFHYPELRVNRLIWLSVFVGVGIIVCELYNMA